MTQQEHPSDESFNAFADQHDLDSDRWLDMSMQEFWRRGWDAALRSSRGEQGWRTMDDAPLNGEEVDLWCRSPGISGGGYARIADCWHSGGCWWRHDENGDDQCRTRVHNATHWRPRPSAPGSVPTSQMRPHGGIAACYDCNRPYGDEFGFPDLVLPNDVWSAISPTKNEGGLLCPSCICKRLHSAGIETHGVFRSGPLSETSLAGQVPNGYVLVPKEPTLEVERSIAYAVAVARQGASSTPRFESPTEYDIDTARAWVRWVVAALSERFSVPPPRDGHSRDCEYVTTDGPAPCTCGFVERDCNAAVARAALQSSPQPTAGGDAPAGVWPDFIAPPQYENPCEGWSDPALPPFRTIWEVARSCGYAVGLHGSMKRDVDLIAAPWVENADASEQLINSLCDALNARMVGPIESKPLGRLAATIQIDAYVKPIDISVMPKDALSAERARVIAQAEAAIRTVIDPIAADPDSAFRNGAIAALAALRALGQQGGAQ